MMDIVLKEWHFGLILNFLSLSEVQRLTRLSQGTRSYILDRYRPPHVEINVTDDHAHLLFDVEWGQEWIARCIMTARRVVLWGDCLPDIVDTLLKPICYRELPNLELLCVRFLGTRSPTSLPGISFMGPFPQLKYLSWHCGFLPVGLIVAQCPSLKVLVVDPGTDMSTVIVPPAVRVGCFKSVSIEELVCIGKSSISPCSTRVEVWPIALKGQGDDLCWSRSLRQLQLQYGLAIDVQRTIQELKQRVRTTGQNDESSMTWNLHAAEWFESLRRELGELCLPKFDVSIHHLLVHERFPFEASLSSALAWEDEAVVTECSPDALCCTRNREEKSRFVKYEALKTPQECLKFMESLSSLSSCWWTTRTATYLVVLTITDWHSVSIETGGPYLWPNNVIRIATMDCTATLDDLYRIGETVYRMSISHLVITGSNYSFNAILRADRLRHLLHSDWGHKLIIAFTTVRYYGPIASELILDMLMGHFDLRNVRDLAKQRSLIYCHGQSLLTLTPRQRLYFNVWFKEVCTYTPPWLNANIKDLFGTRTSVTTLEGINGILKAGLRQQWGSLSYSVKVLPLLPQPL